MLSLDICAFPAAGRTKQPISVSSELKVLQNTEIVARMAILQFTVSEKSFSSITEVFLCLYLELGNGCDWKCSNVLKTSDAQCFSK